MRSYGKVAFRLRKILASMNYGDTLETELLKLSPIQVQAFFRDLSENTELELSASCRESLLVFCRNNPNSVKLEPATKVRFGLMRYIAKNSSLPETLCTYVCTAKIIAAPQ